MGRFRRARSGTPAAMTAGMTTTTTLAKISLRNRRHSRFDLFALAALALGVITSAVLLPL
jgi:hypothetical protein